MTTMWSKEEFLKQLHSNDKYLRAIKEARSEDERKRLAAFGNEFVASFAEILAPLMQQAKDDPKFAERLNKAIAERQQVLTSKAQTSGSSG